MHRQKTGLQRRAVSTADQLTGVSNCNHRPLANPLIAKFPTRRDEAENANWTVTPLPSENVFQPKYGRLKPLKSGEMHETNKPGDFLLDISFSIKRII
jgi:hypothetical protein